MALAGISQFLRLVWTDITPTKVTMTVIRCRSGNPMAMSTRLAFIDHDLLGEQELPKGHPHIDYVAGEESEGVEAYDYNPEQNPEVSAYRLTVKNCDTTLIIAETINGPAAQAVLDCIAKRKKRLRLLQATGQQPGESTTIKIPLKTAHALRDLMRDDIERTMAMTAI